MMYVGFPELTRPERLAGVRALDFSTARLGPAAAIARLEPADFVTRGTPRGIEPVSPVQSNEGIGTPRSVRLAMIFERPAYVVHAGNGAQPRVVFADDGSVLREVTPEIGRSVAARFAERSAWPLIPSSIAFEGELIRDQWSISSALNDHRPLFLYSLNDEKRTMLYVSSRTGEVVRDTHRTERVLNYFGAVTHWIYPTVLRQFVDLWVWLVDIVSSAGTVLAITGLWIGWLRWNRRARPGKLQVPYKGLMRWHYFSGVIFGVVTVTWVFSGLMSMNPLELDPPRAPEAAQQQVFAGTPLNPADFELPAAGFDADVVEVDLVRYDGQPFYRAVDAGLQTRLIGGNAQATRLPSVEAMMARASALLPSARVIEASLLRGYDNYYYSRTPERGDRPLPVIRVRFDDERDTWFHLDPNTGQIIDRLTQANRVFRWLYNGLHSFDIWWLWERRPLWDIVVIAFSLGGTVLSIIGVVIGWRRLRYEPRRREAFEARRAQMQHGHS